jgi:hypothetical protein
MSRSVRFPAVWALAAVVSIGMSIPAFSQDIAAPERRAATGSTQKRAPVQTSQAHVYLLRGLLNIFSLGMDDLAQKIERRGIRASVHNHSEWETLSDQIAAGYKAGNKGAIILVGHSLGADAVMFMGQYLGRKGVPVALIVPFDGTGSFAASSNVQRVMNLTQRDYAYMKKGAGFRGELSNIDLSNQGYGHIDIDKSDRLHNMVINRIVGIVGRGGTRTAVPAAAPKPRPAEAPAEATPAATPSAAPAAAPAGGSGSAAPASRSASASGASELSSASPATTGTAGEKKPEAKSEGKPPLRF